MAKPIVPLPIVPIPIVPIPIVPTIEALPPGTDPWIAFLALADLPGAILLESAARDPRLGRFSFAAADPFARVVWRHGDPGDPLDLLRRAMEDAAGRPLQARDGPDPLPGLPPFRGGAAGLLGFGIGRAFEEIPPPRCDDLGAPDLAVGLYDAVLAFDHAAGRAWAISLGLPERDPAARKDRARRRLEGLLRRLAAPPRSPAEIDARCMPVRQLPLEDLAQSFPVPGRPGIHSDFTPEGYRGAVAHGVELVRSGDIFQVNLAQRLLAPARCGPLELYGKLRERNPAPFAGFLDLGGGLSVASASPERFLRLEGEVAEARPIKGTRPRGRTPDEDRALAGELRASAKDRAENVMIVDLLRNDLSRVARPGTVEVPELFALESYATVHHLVSTVRARLREGQGPLDLVRAAFPGGSVTGAPKVRALEVIAELEPTARGPYCGSLGYLGFDGALDLSVLIRTVTAAGGWLRFPVGAGITARSDPDEEYAETIAKAEGILRAID